MATKKLLHQLTVPQFEKAFPDEKACCAYLVSKRWPDGVKCPRCGAANPTELKGNPWHWQCYRCAPVSSYRFSHISGTIFENTNKPLLDWFKVAHLMLTSKKGMSALQICRYMGFGSYKTAWYMCHRIRVALRSGDSAKLGGIVEVDETFVGGKAKNRHGNDRDGSTGGTGSGKSVVVGAVQRRGNVVARVIANVKAEALTGFVREAVADNVSLLVTDQWMGYRQLRKQYPHKVINHAQGQYVVGAIHTNTIEGFWSILKRGVVGTFHKVSKKYLPLYVAEFQFRYNNRLNQDIFGAAIAGC
jgi:transposase-like protein